MSLVPQLTPVKPDAAETVQVPHDGEFRAFLKTVADAVERRADERRPVVHGASKERPAQQIEAALQTLTDGRVELSAPGLGLTRDEGKQLVASLETLLNSDPTALAAQPLLAAVIAPLLQLLATGADGAVGADAVLPNVKLLMEAIQLSGEGLTLTQALHELAPVDDAFVQQLAIALQPEAANLEPDTPLPRVAGSGEETRAGPSSDTRASTSAGSNGHELTAAPVAASPADGATEEVQMDELDPVGNTLAKALEALLKAGQKADRQVGAVAVATADPQVGAATEGDAPTNQLGLPMQAGSAQTKPVAQPMAPTGTTLPVQLPAQVVASRGADASLQDGQGQGQGQRGAPPEDQAQTGQVAGAATVTAASAQASLPLDLSKVAVPAVVNRPALEQAIVDQIVQRATLAIQNGQREFRIQLRPEFLGAMEIRVSIDQGQALVRMATEHASTRQLIDANMGQLKAAFGTVEVRVEHVPTFASADAALTFGQHGQQGFWHGQNPFDGASRLPEAIAFSGEAEDEPGTLGGTTSEESTNSAALGGVDIKA